MVRAVARRNRRGYREYRGRRRKGSTALKVIVILLAVLLVAGIVFTLFLGRYIEYTDDGVRINLPWMQDDDSDEPISSEPLVIITDQPSAEPTAPPVETIGAVEVAVSQLTDGSALQTVKQAGGNALVVEMKNAYGRLAWNSKVPQAQAMGVSAADDAVARAVGELAEGDEVYLVARVNGYRDLAMANAKVGGPLMTRGGNVWYDANGLCWVSPAADEAVDYLAALCLELADMGFDEILLDCGGYPYFGEVHVLAQSELRPAELSAPVGDGWQTIREALDGTGTKLSCLVTGEMVNGTEAYSGITAGLLADGAHRVWVDVPQGDTSDYAALLEQAGMESAARRLVLLGGAAEDASWAAIKGPAR